MESYKRKHFEATSRNLIAKTKQLLSDEPEKFKNGKLTYLYRSILKSKIISLDFFDEIYELFITILEEPNGELSDYSDYIEPDSPDKYINRFWSSWFVSSLLNKIEFLRKYYTRMYQGYTGWQSRIIKHSSVAFEFFTSQEESIDVDWYNYTDNPYWTAEQILFLMDRDNHSIFHRSFGYDEFFCKLNIAIISHPNFPTDYRSSTFLAVQSYVTEEFVLEHPDWRFKVEGLLYNPNMSWDFLKTHFGQEIKRISKDKHSGIASYYHGLINHQSKQKLIYQLKSKLKDIPSDDITEFNLTALVKEVKDMETDHPKPFIGNIVTIEEKFLYGNFTAEQFIELASTSKTDKLIGLLCIFENKKITITTLTKFVKHFYDYIPDRFVDVSNFKRPFMTLEMFDLIIEQITKDTVTLKYCRWFRLIQTIYDIMNDDFYKRNFDRLNKAALCIQKRFMEIWLNPYTEIGRRKINRDYDDYAKGKSKK
jgi:hypothetical protein